MPRPTARLANCYVPLPLNSSSFYPSDARSQQQNVRTDRKPAELRQLCLETGVLTNGGLGSSLIELGHTKVLCQVSMVTSHPDSLQDEGILECKVKFAPHVGVDQSLLRAQAVTPIESTTLSAGRLNSTIISREVNLSSQLHSAIIPVIPLQKFPKCAFVIQVTILQDDGSVLSACIIAASLALADARVEMFDFVTSCTVAVYVPDNHDEAKSSEEEGERSHQGPIFLADPTEVEGLGASAVICLAMTPNFKEVTLWRQMGALDAMQANEAIELCRNGCRTMHKFMREVWVS